MKKRGPPQEISMSRFESFSRGFMNRTGQNRRESQYVTRTSHSHDSGPSVIRNHRLLSPARTEKKESCYRLPFQKEHAAFGVKDGKNCRCQFQAFPFCHLSRYLASKTIKL